METASATAAYPRDSAAAGDVADADAETNKGTENILGTPPAKMLRTQQT